MDATHYRNEISRLEKAFQTNITDERRTPLWNIINGYQDRHITAAVTALINSQTRFPSNAEIIGAIRIIQDQDWREAKEKERQQTKDFLDGRKSRTPYDAAALQTLKKVMHSRSKFETIAAFNSMITQYPGHGYEQQLTILKRKWQSTSR
jgi:hypothetical protein